MSNRSWRGTILFTVIFVTMSATAGLKMYGVGEEATSTDTSVIAPRNDSASGTTSGSDAGPSTSPSQTASPSPSPSTSTITGEAVDTRYGVIQVSVTFSGDTLTAVETLQSPSHSGRDIQINQRALPILEQEVLSSQSASVDTVSGATYTSEGYMQSVQSAIDQR